MRKLLCVAAALAALSSLPGQARLSPEQLVRLGRVGGLRLAEDGESLRFSVRTADIEANRSRSRTFRLSLGQGGAPVEVDPEPGPDLPDGAANVLRSPDGKTVAFTRRVRLDLPVTAAYPDLPEARARAYDDLMIRHWDRWNDGTYSHLFVVPADGSGEPRDLMAGERVHTPLQPFGGVEQIAFSPDGREICYTARRVPDPEASTDSQLWVVPVEGGEHRCLTPDNPGYDTDPVYSPDGRWIAYSSMATAGFESDRNRLMLHDRRTGENRELLPDFDASPRGVVWSPDSRRLFFVVDVEGTSQIFTAALPREGIPAVPFPVTRGRHAFSSLRVSPDATALYALRTTMERPAEVVRVDVTSGDVTALTDVNGEVYRNLALPVIEPAWFDATDGRKIHAWIVKPPGFDPAKKYPFLLYCQGGPQSMVGQGFSFRWNFHLMAAQGYVIAGVNRRGLPGFGQEWNDRISRDWGGQAMQDLLSVCDAMQRRPYIDRKRSAAIGASFGGYSVYWLMGNAGDRFACMLAHCGVFNLESMYLSTEELFFVNHDLGGPYWASAEVADEYRRFSPHRYVRNWKTPLMVIEGERDYRVPYDQGLQAFTAAQVMGVPSRLLVFPDEGHWILKPQNAVLWHREFYAWLDRFCGRRDASDK